MDSWIDKILSQRKQKPKLKRFLIQTGNKKVTGIFFIDGVESYETNYIPVFKDFIQVICYSKLECIQYLKLQNIEYCAIHEVIHPLIIDGAELHRDLFKNIPLHLNN
jgi:hypothetical protein